MSTYTFNSLCHAGSDANFRGWGSGLSSGLQAGGLIKTSDTGQINWATVTYPTVNNTSQGYEIYRFNDSLQGTVPVFFKVEYGLGGGSAIPAIWITVGTGSDGAGNITGVLFARTQIACTNYNAGTQFPSRVSVGSNRVCFMLWITSFCLTFSLERSHTSNGADTNDGLLVLYGVLGIASNAFSQSLSFTGTSGSLYNKWNCCAPPTGTGVLGVNTYLYPVRGWNPGETCPSINIYQYFSADLTAQNVISASMWDGSTVSIHPTNASNASAYYGGTVCVAIRAD